MQLDTDSGDVRLKINEDDLGIIWTRRAGAGGRLPVYPMLTLGPGEAVDLLRL